MPRRLTHCRHTEGFTEEDRAFLDRHIQRGDGNRFRDPANPVPTVDMHDCIYVEARNRLIPRAMQLAHERTVAALGREEIGSPRGDVMQTRNFLAAMTELAVAAGLQKAGPSRAGALS